MGKSRQGARYLIVKGKRDGAVGGGRCAQERAYICTFQMRETGVLSLV